MYILGLFHHVSNTCMQLFIIVKLNKVKLIEKGDIFVFFLMIKSPRYCPFLCSPKGEIYSCLFVCVSVWYLIRQI